MEIEPRIRSATINERVAENVTVHYINGSGKIVKIPVLLQSIEIQIPTHANIEFPKEEHVLEIKDIKKRVFLSQCKLLHSGNGGTLFISGFVRKNIQYAHVRSKLG